LKQAVDGFDEAVGLAGLSPGCVFHTKLDKDFAASWTAISRQAGQ
jgi:hypothetical protein